MKTLKPPRFKTEAEERKFWETHNSTDYVDWSKANRTRLPKLRPSADGNVMLDETKITEAVEWASNQTSLIEDDCYNAYSDLLDFFEKTRPTKRAKCSWRGPCRLRLDAYDP